MTCPQVITTTDIIKSNTAFLHEDGRWLPDRGEFGYDGASCVRQLIQRFRMAYQVFIGRYDALDWERSQ